MSTLEKKCFHLNGHTLGFTFEESLNKSVFDWWAPNPNLGQCVCVCVCQLGYQNSAPIFDKILQFPYPIPLVFTMICGWQCQTAENVRKK